MKKKINKNEFLENIAAKHNISVADARSAYDLIVDEIRCVICSGSDLSVTGFGTFSLQKHKGHPVQFKSKRGTVDDYVVLKFAVSDVLMSKIRESRKD